MKKPTLIFVVVILVQSALLVWQTMAIVDMRKRADQILKWERAMHRELLLQEPARRITQ